MAERFHKLGDVFMHKRMVQNDMLPILILLFCGEFAIQDQVSGFQVVGTFSQLLNGIAAVAQNTFIAINVSDFALG